MKCFLLAIKCGDCDEYAKVGTAVDFLGHNPGEDGHFYKTLEEAKNSQQYVKGVIGLRTRVVRVTVEEM